MLFVDIAVRLRTSILLGLFQYNICTLRALSKRWTRGTAHGPAGSGGATAGTGGANALEFRATAHWHPVRWTRGTAHGPAGAGGATAVLAAMVVLAPGPNNSSCASRLDTACPRWASFCTSTNVCVLDFEARSTRCRVVSRATPHWQSDRESSSSSAPVKIRHCLDAGNPSGWAAIMLFTVWATEVHMIWRGFRNVCIH